LDNGHRTRDLARSGQKSISTSDMGSLVVEAAKETATQRVLI
jgi:hypothetical protein